MIGSGVVFEIGGERYHSYTDLGLIMTARPSVSPPEPYINMVDVPGRDKPLDFSEALDGCVHFKTRAVSMSFMRLSDPDRWPKEISNVLRLLHGKRVKVYMDDDPNWYYDCRFTVETPTYKKHAWYVTITGTADPYKYFRYTTIDDMPAWVTYDDGIDRHYTGITVNDGEHSNVTVNVYGFDCDIVPIIHVRGTDGCTLTVKNGYYYSDDIVAEGEDVTVDYIPGFAIESGLNEIKFESYNFSDAEFTVSIEYRGLKL